VHGAMQFNSNGSFAYKPAAGFTGADTFTYRINDGVVNGNTATVTIAVQ
jgi:large repetitive protein